MIRLVLLLLGADFIRKYWRTLAVIGAIWGLLGLALFIDALDGVMYFPIHVFGYLLIIEALVTLVATTSNRGTQTVLRKARGVIFLLLGLLIIDPHHASSFILAMIFGLVFAVDGILRIASAHVVRFAGWRLSMLLGVGELIFAIFMFEPYPTYYVGTVPYCIGVALMLSGFGTLRLAFRLRKLPPRASVLALLSRGDGESVAQLDAAAAQPTGNLPTLTVHVWTPVGSAVDALPQPLLDRYVAAVDGNGVISTGHAALEVPGLLYISHYPASEIDHSPEDFRSILRATKENDVPGKFQPSYAQESAGWCASTAKVLFERYNLSRLEAFWARYSQDTTYNLTNRNCSSTVALALEVSMEGTFGGGTSGLLKFLSAMVNPELWVASQLQKHAQAAAWTPGLVLDYARALKVAIDPPPLGVVTLTKYIGSAWRYTRAVRRGEPLHRSANSTELPKPSSASGEALKGRPAP
jgi:uncharacterized membrane protein HdeD (DUF308 family)